MRCFRVLPIKHHTQPISKRNLASYALQFPENSTSVRLDQGVQKNLPQACSITLRTSRRQCGKLGSVHPSCLQTRQTRLMPSGHFFGLAGPCPVKPPISHFTAAPLHRHPYPQLPYPTATPFTRSASLFDSPGPQALLIHKVRRPHQSTWPAGLIN